MQLQILPDFLPSVWHGPKCLSIILSECRAVSS